MATRYEYYITGDNAYEEIYGTRWSAQTFTPAVAHKITSVKLLIFRSNSPGTLTVSIRATDGSGHPTGNDLCSGTIDGDALSGVNWVEITLGAGYTLVASTKYAIVIRALSGDSSNYVGWRLDYTSPAYIGGIYEISTDSGANWDSGNYDYMFEDWGVPIYTIHEKTLTDGFDIGEVLIKNPIKVLSDGIYMGDVLVKQAIKILSDGIAVGESLTGYKIMVKTLSDGIAVGEVLCKHTIKILSDGVQFTDTLIKMPIKVLSDGIAIGEILVKLIVKVLVDGIKFADVHFITFIKVFVDGIKFHDFLLKWRWLTPLRRLTPYRLWQPKRRTEL